MPPQRIVDALVYNLQEKKHTLLVNPQRIVDALVYNLQEKKHTLLVNPLHLRRTPGTPAADQLESLPLFDGSKRSVDFTRVLWLFSSFVHTISVFIVSLH